MYVRFQDGGVDDFLDTLDDYRRRFKQVMVALGWREEDPVPDYPGLKRYPSDNMLDWPTETFKSPVIHIVVPSEEAREQVMLACRYLHDLREIDTGYIAVNHLVHLYTDEMGKQSGVTPHIIVEPSDEVLCAAIEAAADRIRLLLHRSQDVDAITREVAELFRSHIRDNA